MEVRARSALTIACGGGAAAGPESAVPYRSSLPGKTRPRHRRRPARDRANAKTVGDRRFASGPPLGLLRYVAHLRSVDRFCSDKQPEAGGPWPFDRYGFRVPAVVVSPYARPGYVSHVERDHTSVLKLIERKWNLPPMTARDAAADDLLDMVDFKAPAAFGVPPELPGPTAATPSPGMGSHAAAGPSRTRTGLRR